MCVCVVIDRCRPSICKLSYEAFYLSSAVRDNKYISWQTTRGGITFAGSQHVCVCVCHASRVTRQLTEETVPAV